MSTAISEIDSLIPKKKRKSRQRVMNDLSLLLFAMPGIIYVIIYNYIPMYGITIAFKDFSPYDGILGFRQLVGRISAFQPFFFLISILSAY